MKTLLSLLMVSNMVLANCVDATSNGCPIVTAATQPSALVLAPRGLPNTVLAQEF